MSLINHTICPYCGHEHDRSSAVVEKGNVLVVEPRMKPGDVTMCIKCGEFSVMGWDEMLREPTQAETHDLDNDHRIKHLRDAWRATVKRLQA
jgi:hypothetical protein